MLSLEAWVNSLPMLSDSAKEAIFADVRNAEDLDEVASGSAKPSLTKIEELLHGEMRIFEQDLAKLKETMRRCEAQMKRKFPQQQKDQDGETRLGPSPDDGAAFRPAKRPHIVTPDLQETAQLSSGATKKSTASTTTTRGRNGTLSDKAWARERATSSRDLPAQRPVYVTFSSPGWNYRCATTTGKNTSYQTIEAVYDAAIKDQQQHPPVPRRPPTIGLSDDMWQRERTKSSLDLPEKRPKRLTYEKRSRKWQVIVNNRGPVYDSLDAAYNALQQQSTS